MVICFAFQKFKLCISKVHVLHLSCRKRSIHCGMGMFLSHDVVTNWIRSSEKKNLIFRCQNTLAIAIDGKHSCIFIGSTTSNHFQNSDFGSFTSINEALILLYINETFSFISCRVRIDNRCIDDTEILFSWQCWVNMWLWLHLTRTYI